MFDQQTNQHFKAVSAMLNARVHQALPKSKQFERDHVEFLIETAANELIADARVAA